MKISSHVMSSLVKIIFFGKTGSQSFENTYVKEFAEDCSKIYFDISHIVCDIVIMRIFSNKLVEIAALSVVN